MRLIIFQHESISPRWKPIHPFLSQLHFKCFLSEVTTSTNVQMTHQWIDNRPCLNINHFHATAQDIRIQQIGSRSILYLSLLLLPFPRNRWFDNNTTPRWHLFHRYIHFSQGQCVINVNGRGPCCYPMVDQRVIAYVMRWLPSGVNKQDKTEQGEYGLLLSSRE